MRVNQFILQLVAFFRSGDEATAMGIMTRLNKLGNEMGSSDGSGTDADDSTDSTLGI